MSENEIKEHHKYEFPEKERNIQTLAKIEQNNLEELKYFSSVMNSVDKIEIAKKG